MCSPWPHTEHAKHSQRFSALLFVWQFAVTGMRTFRSHFVHISPPFRSPSSPRVCHQLLPRLDFNIYALDWLTKCALYLFHSLYRTNSLLLLSQTLTKSSVKLLSIFFPAQHGVCVMWVWVWVFLKNRVIQYSLPTRCCFDKFTVCVRGSSYVCLSVCVCWLAHISIDMSIMELWINML